MNIVMDFRKYDGVVGGVEQVVMQIISQIAPQGHTFILLSKQSRLDEVKNLFKDIPNVRHQPLPVETHAIGPKNAYHDSVTIQNIAAAENAPVIHFPYNWSFPFRKKAKTILTIHDVIPFTFREAMGWFRHRFIYKPALRRACRLNDVITTISEFSRRDIAAKTGTDPDRIRVIPNGFRRPASTTDRQKTALAERLGLTGPFILNVGGIHERKNVPRLIEAFGIFQQQVGYPGRLVITGKVAGAPYQEKMKARCDAAVARAQLAGKVLFTGFVSDPELDILLAAADFLVYPSLYEGFGIPILEAMNVGTPVITADATATAEVAGQAALLADPTSSEALATAMVKLHQDAPLRAKLSELGRRRVETYTWDQLASRYLQLYQELAEGR
ncbi:MAG: glycosyltransferase family 4 protein [Sedimentisphaerales bacterium]|nr:glycosyltransferase family 4 protein [Sedimentisphaerales bacterium]